jgi:hypothetical protein
VTVPKDSIMSPTTTTAPPQRISRHQGTFLLFAGFCVVTFVYVRWFLPETKGKTLEEVQEMWSDPAELHRSIHTWK